MVGRQLGSDPNNNNAPAIVFSEDGTTYYLDVDPSQDFLNQTFVLSPDASGGTDIALAQAPIDTAVTIPSGQTVYGALVADGGLVGVQAAGTLNYAVIDSGGVVEVETGGSVEKASISAPRVVRSRSTAPTCCQTPRSTASLRMTPSTCANCL